MAYDAEGFAYWDGAMIIHLVFLVWDLDETK